MCGGDPDPVSPSSESSIDPSTSLSSEPLGTGRPSLVPQFLAFKVRDFGAAGSGGDETSAGRPESSTSRRGRTALVALRRLDVDDFDAFDFDDLLDLDDLDLDALAFALDALDLALVLALTFLDNLSFFADAALVPFFFRLGFLPADAAAAAAADFALRGRPRPHFVLALDGEVETDDSSASAAAPPPVDERLDSLVDLLCC